MTKHFINNLQVDLTNCKSYCHSCCVAADVLVVVVDQVHDGDDDGHEAPFAPQIFFTKAGGKEAFSILTPSTSKAAELSPFSHPAVAAH